MGNIDLVENWLYYRKNDFRIVYGADTLKIDAIGYCQGNQTKFTKLFINLFAGFILYLGFDPVWNKADLDFRIDLLKYDGKKNGRFKTQSIIRERAQHRSALRNTGIKPSSSSLPGRSIRIRSFGFLWSKGSIAVNSSRDAAMT